MPGRPFVLVLAGVNGAGKSSVGGALLAESGLDWFNPDTFARELIQNSGLSQEVANSRAWEYGRSRLESALATGANYAFETTLGGRTIARLLARASETHDVMMLFCGLATPEQHIARVALRVAHGGHAIAEQKIRERWVTSRANLINLMPKLAHLQVFDNSADAEPGQDIADPLLLLEMIGGSLQTPAPNDIAALNATPHWARALVQAAIELAEIN